jgi:hypothetical protein
MIEGAMQAFLANRYEGRSKDLIRFEQHAGPFDEATEAKERE